MISHKIDFREIITSRLERQGRTLYWLHKQLCKDPTTEISSTAFYQYFSGKYAWCKSTQIEKMIAILDLSIKPIDKPRQSVKV